MSRTALSDRVTPRAKPETPCRLGRVIVILYVMAISLSPETQELIEQRMKETGVDNPDELVQAALQTLHQVRGVYLDELDDETRAAIEEGLDQAERGEGRAWADVRKEIHDRFIAR